MNSFEIRVSFGSLFFFHILEQHRIKDLCNLCKRCLSYKLLFSLLILNRILQYIPGGINVAIVLSPCFVILIQSLEKNKAVLYLIIFATSHTDRVGTNQLGTVRTFS